MKIENSEPTVPHVKYMEHTASNEVNTLLFLRVSLHIVLVLCIVSDVHIKHSQGI